MHEFEFLEGRVGVGRVGYGRGWVGCGGVGVEVGVGVEGMGGVG